MRISDKERPMFRVPSFALLCSSSLPLALRGRRQKFRVRHRQRARSETDAGAKRRAGCGLSGFDFEVWNWAIAGDE